MKVLKLPLFLGIILSISTASLAQAPTYDEPCGAISLPVSYTSDGCLATATGIDMANITFASGLALPTAGTCVAGNTNPDAWFKFVGPSNQQVVIYLQQNYWNSANTSYIQIIYADACNSAYYNQGCFTVNSNVTSGQSFTIPTSGGITYYIRYVRGQLDTPATIKMCLTTGAVPPSSKVGINTNEPATNFDVAGETRFRHSVTVLGNEAINGSLTVGGGVSSGSGFGGKNYYAEADGSADKFMVGLGYNNIKWGNSFYKNPNVYGSALHYNVWSSTDFFIWGRGDPHYGSYMSPTYFAEYMRLGDGKLGLGTTALDARLNIAGQIKIVDGNQGAAKVLTSDANGLASWQSLPAVANPWTTNGSNIYKTSNSGNVGIGTSTPGFPLNFGNSLGDKISLWGNSGAHYGFGVQSGLLQIHSDAQAADIAFGYGSSGTFNETMRIKGNGLLMVKSTSQESMWINGPGGNYITLAENGVNRGYLGSYSGADQDVELGTHTANPTGKVHLSTGNIPRLTASSNGFIGIGRQDPHVPLAFNNPFGQIAISLFKGGLGDVGLGVWSNELRIQCDNPFGKVAFGTLDANGNYFELAKASNENQKFTVNGFINVGGTIYSSDERFKKNIKKLDGSLGKVLQLAGYEYDMKDEEFKSRLFGKAHQIGLLAQQVEKIVPEAVQEIADGYKGVDYARLVPLLIEAIKEQQKLIDSLMKKVDNK